MKRSRLQLLGYLTGICILFALGSFLMPELRADTREPLDPFVAKNLPAETGELIYFNAAALDATGATLLEKAVSSAGSLDRNLWTVLSLMFACEKNKGSFYLAQVPGFGAFVLLKNGTDSDEMIMAPGFADQGMTVRKLPEGYFALYPMKRKLPALGLPEELGRKIAAGPGEVLRSCKGKGAPSLVSIVNRNGVYTLAATLPQEAGTRALTPETVAEKAVSYLPEGEKAAKKAFVADNLKFSEKNDACEVEFPLNEKTLTLWSDYIRRNREDREKKDEPKIVALSPENGATGVDPNLKEIKVTFDRPMSTTSWSFCQRSDSDFPEVLTKPSFDKTGTVITLPVRLVPERTYNIYLNSPPFIGFQSAKGGVLQSVHYTFTTGK